MNNKKYLTPALFFLFSCSSKDVKYVKANTWQYESGFKIGEGDMVDFDYSSRLFLLRSDTIFFRGNPRALIKSVNKKSNEMVITSIDKKEKGVYVNIKEFTK